MLTVEYEEVEWWLSQWSGLFDWDAHNIEKLAKHNLTAEEVESIFESATAFGGRVVPPPGAAWTEKRFVTFGQTDAGRLVCLVWTAREDAIRPISCRSMRHEEKRQFKDRT